MDFKRKLLAIAVPVVLVAAGATSIAATRAATPSPSPTKASQSNEPAETQNETGDKTEAPEAPGAADVGHADNPNDANADHQFDGQE